MYRGDEVVETLTLRPQATGVLRDVGDEGGLGGRGDVVVDVVDLLGELGEVPGEAGRVAREGGDEVVDVFRRREDPQVALHDDLRAEVGEELGDRGLVSLGVVHGPSISFLL